MAESGVLTWQSCSTVCTSMMESCMPLWIPTPSSARDQSGACMLHAGVPKDALHDRVRHAGSGMLTWESCRAVRASTMESCVPLWVPTPSSARDRSGACMLHARVPKGAFVTEMGMLSQRG